MHLDYWRLLQRNEEMLYSNDEFFLIWVFSKCTIIFIGVQQMKVHVLLGVLNIFSWKKRKNLDWFVLIACSADCYASILFILYFLRLLLTSSWVMTWNESEANGGGTAVGHVTTGSVERRHTYSITVWYWVGLIRVGIWHVA